MGRRGLRARTSIANLGFHAVKRRRLNPEEKENYQDVSCILPESGSSLASTVLALSPFEVYQHYNQVFLQIARPTSLPGSTPSTEESPASNRPSPTFPSSISALYLPPPSIKEAKLAWEDIKNLLEPRRKTGRGRKQFVGNCELHGRMVLMRAFLYRFSQGLSGWMESSEIVAAGAERGGYMARELRRWTRNFLEDRHLLPTSTMMDGVWNQSLLEKHPTLKLELMEHLQTIGKYVRALDIVEYMAKDEVKTRYSLKKTISLTTAQRWMHDLDYRWAKEPHGQFVDGHERADVVDDRIAFLQKMLVTDIFTRHWDKDGNELDVPMAGALRPGEYGPTAPRVVYWYHDESTFYAHDRRLVRWVHTTEKAVPRAKGEGISIMVADFVSADYGWLRSPDGTESARILFEAGKNRDGYFTTQDILKHATLAMDILQRHYPHERHVLIYDNASTHLARAPDALSARRMSLKPTLETNPLFGADRTKTGPDGRPLFNPDGTSLKERIRMEDASFNGAPQSLYFPQGHPREGVFKGMKIILEERGINVAGKLAQCNRNFKCPAPAVDCCVRRILYNQPDFRNVETLLVSHCKERGFEVRYLPKFHCELNPIEQCWGAAKREYRKFPASSAEEDLKRNVVAALDSVPLASIRRYFTRSMRFMDAYRHGLSGQQAMWAAKKYSSHRVIPSSLLHDLDEAGLA